MSNGMRTLMLVMAVALPRMGAAQGIIEINQTCATTVGCLPSDSPGFPVEINDTGSYALTGDLKTGAGQPAIDLRRNQIDLDLRGFTIEGSITGGSASAIVANSPFGQDARIHNGTIRSFLGKGIDLPGVSGVRIEEVLVYDNQGGGIDIGENGLVTQARVRGNGTFGMRLGKTTAYDECVVTEHFEGQAVEGGVQLGGSYCDDASCTPYRPLRAYYLTEQTVPGAAALGQCDDGFHMASIFEIADPTLLRYDNARGRTEADSGQGPPTEKSTPTSVFENYGWIRTGSPPEVSTGSSMATNCDVWTSTSGGDVGTIYALINRARVSTPTNVELAFSGWDSTVVSCIQAKPVWCVQD